MDLSELKAIDRLLRNNQYPDEVFLKILPYVASYFDSAPELRALPVEEVKAATVMLPGGTR